MPYASAPGSFSTRAASVSKPLPVFRGRKRNPVSTSCKPASHASHNLVGAGPEVMGMEAFQETFVAYRPKFVGIAYSILRNKEDAEDAVQDAVLSAYMHLRNFLDRKDSSLATRSGNGLRGRRNSPIDRRFAGKDESRASAVIHDDLLRRIDEPRGMHFAWRFFRNFQVTSIPGQATPHASSPAIACGPHPQSCSFSMFFRQA